MRPAARGARAPGRDGRAHRLRGTRRRRDRCRRVVELARALGREERGRTAATELLERIERVRTVWDAVALEQPELIVLAPCGFDAERARQEAAGLNLPAPAVAVDANAYFARPSLRVADGVEQLARLLHPEAFATAA